MMKSLVARFVASPLLHAGLAAAAAALLLAGCFGALLAGGAATGVALVATDRRVPDVMLGDERIEQIGGDRIAQRLGDKAHVNVTSYNLTVLLTGEVPDEKAKEVAEQTAAQVDRVKAVVNELEIAGMSSLAARANDTYLTGRIKSAYVAAQKFSATHVKVVTEAGVVYLMGLVTRREADDATELARSISGVRKVVRVLEYLSAPAAAK
jgi:osmotically-inducible protein OsmY